MIISEGASNSGLFMDSGRCWWVWHGRGLSGHFTEGHDLSWTLYMYVASIMNSLGPQKVSLIQWKCSLGSEMASLI